MSRYNNTRLNLNILDSASHSQSVEPTNPSAMFSLIFGQLASSSQRSATRQKAALGTITYFFHDRTKRPELTSAFCNIANLHYERLNNSGSLPNSAKRLCSPSQPVGNAPSSKQHFVHVTAWLTGKACGGHNATRISRSIATLDLTSDPWKAR